MFKLLFMLYELQPTIQFKRSVQRWQMFLAGQKQRRKGELMMLQNQRPIYQIPEQFKTLIMAKKNEIKLNDEQIRVGKSMGLYWDEIFTRDNAEQVAKQELPNAVAVLGAKNILLILNEYVNKYPFKRGRIKKNWAYDNEFGEGTEFVILGEPVELRGQMWTPIILDKEEDPTWCKTAGIEII